MKILKQNELIRTCYRCATIFEFNKEDLQEFTGGSSRKFPNGISPYVGVKCPLCGAIIKVFEEKIL